MKPALPHSLPGALSSRFSSISLSSNLPQAPIKWIITAPKSSLRGFPLIPSRHLTPFLLSWWHNELLFRGEPLNRPLWKCGMCQGPGQSGSWWLACWGQRGHQGHRVPQAPGWSSIREALGSCSQPGTGRIQMLSLSRGSRALTNHLRGRLS